MEASRAKSPNVREEEDNHEVIQALLGRRTDIGFSSADL